MAGIPIKFVQDVGKFYDTRTPQSKYITFETAQNRLKALDPKFAEDASALHDIMQDIMAAPISSADVKSAKKGKDIDWVGIWEALMPFIPLRKRTNNNGQAQYFFVSENNEVSPIEYTDDEALFNALQHRVEVFKQVREFYNSNDMMDMVRPKLPLKLFVLKMIKEYLMADERCLFHEEPKQISWEYDELAYKKMNPDLLKAGPTPTWDEFTRRLDYPAVFMAWVWSIFEPKNNIRLVMWLKGVGNDGKSSVQKAIESVIGRQYCFSLKPGDESEKWFQKNVFGKVLVNYADCRNVYLIDHNNVKQLTGGDTTSIEGKGENAFTGKIYSKLLVTSNFTPKINPDFAAQTTRLIKLEVAPQSETKKDSGFEIRLADEIYAFLFNCRAAFDELISAGYDKLLLPTELEDRMKIDCASETYLNVEDFVQEHVVFNGESVADPAEFKTLAKNYFMLNKRLSSDQLRYHIVELENKLFKNGCWQDRIAVEEDSELKKTMWRGFCIKDADKVLKTI